MLLEIECSCILAHSLTSNSVILRLDKLGGICFIIFILVTKIIQKKKKKYKYYPKVHSLLGFSCHVSNLSTNMFLTL